MVSTWPIVFMGTPKTAAMTLESLLEGPDPVVGVVTQPARPFGRGQHPVPSPVSKIASHRGIRVLSPDKIRDAGFMEILRSWNPQVIVVVAYGRILPKAILDLAPQGCINVHYSLLPKYRGAAPVAWTIINGEQRSGVTTMQLVEKMDAGPIFLQEAIAVDPEETTESLQAKLTPLGARLLRQTIRRLKEGSLQAVQQNDADVSFAPLIKKEDGLVDWGQPAVVIERKVRGFTPWPSAYTYLRGKLLKIHRAKPITNASGNAGEIIQADQHGFCVATGAGALSLEEVQLENKKRLPGVEFIKGARIQLGERL